jgi:hypothetical protein
MNQATLLQESRLKHLLRSSEAAAKQLRAFKAVLPISKRNLESSAPAPKSAGSSSKPRRSN